MSIGSKIQLLSISISILIPFQLVDNYSELLCDFDLLVPFLSKKINDYLTIFHLFRNHGFLSGIIC